MQGKRAAGQATIDYLVPFIETIINERGRVILGIGTGSTMVYVMEALKATILQKHWQPHQLVGIPTSRQSQQLIVSTGILIGSLIQFPRLDFALDGADEIDASGRFIIKGGGGALFMEKVVASAADKFIVIADDSKYNEGAMHKLGVSWKGGIPLAIYPEAEHVISRRFANQAPTIYYTKTRNMPANAGKMGCVVSDQGHVLMDLLLTGSVPDQPPKPDTYFGNLEGLAAMLDSIPGIISHGLFMDMASLIILGSNDSGTARLIKPKSQ